MTKTHTRLFFGQKNKNTQIYINIYTHTQTHTYIYINFVQQKKRWRNIDNIVLDDS